MVYSPADDGYFKSTCEVTFGWSGKITRGDENELPADFVIDYVRAYQYKDKI